MCLLRGFVFNFIESLRAAYKWLVGQVMQTLQVHNRQVTSVHRAFEWGMVPVGNSHWDAIGHWVSFDCLKELF